MSKIKVDDTVCWLMPGSERFVVGDLVYENCKVLKIRGDKALITLDDDTAWIDIVDLMKQEDYDAEVAETERKAYAGHLQ
jgi:hypothetical protein